MLEATMLVMEALEGLEGKYEYAIRGHSGESDGVEFVEFGQPPSNRGERLKVLQRMVAHSQFCDTGDRTIEATRRAISDVSARGFVDDEEERKHLVVALSDANFSRYGLDPRWWAEALSDSDAVDAHAVMVGSIADEASLVAGALPRGGARDGRRGRAARRLQADPAARADYRRRGGDVVRWCKLEYCYGATTSGRALGESFVCLVGLPKLTPGLFVLSHFFDVVA